MPKLIDAEDAILSAQDVPTLEGLVDWINSAMFDGDLDISTHDYLDTVAAARRKVLIARQN